MAVDIDFVQTFDILIVNLFVDIQYQMPNLGQVFSRHFGGIPDICQQKCNEDDRSFPLICDMYGNAT